jgi:hypothetical protein
MLDVMYYAMNERVVGVAVECVTERSKQKLAAPTHTDKKMPPLCVCFVFSKSPLHNTQHTKQTARSLGDSKVSAKVTANGFGMRTEKLYQNW